MLVRLFNLWINGRLSAYIGSDLSLEAYRRTLYQPYEIHLDRNTSYVITQTTSHVRLTVIALNAFLQFITCLVVGIFLLFGLFLVNKIITLSAVGFFGISYSVLILSVRKKLLANSQRISYYSANQLKALQEGLGAIRDVLLCSSQAVYLDIYKKSDRPQRILQANNAFITVFPRFALEAMGMIGIAVLGSLLIAQNKPEIVIPTLGTFALGVQRLLPSLQQIYRSWAVIKGNTSSINGVLTMLDQKVIRSPMLHQQSLLTSLKIVNCPIP